MAWSIEYTHEFQDWWTSLSQSEQEDVAASVTLLEARGPSLGRPHVDTVNGSRHANMKELRTQSSVKPLRTFFCI